MENKERKNEKEKNQKKQSELVTKESFSAVCALFSFLALLILFTRSLIFGGIGWAVHSFLTGVFGYMAYPVMFGALYLSVTSLFEKRLVKNRAAGTCIALAVVFLSLLFHSIFTFSWGKIEYLTRCFRAGETFPATTAAGWLGGLVVYAISALTTNVGAIIIFSALTLFFAYLATVFARRKDEKTKKEKQPEAAANQTVAPVEIPLSTAPAQTGQGAQPTQPTQPAQMRPQENLQNAYAERGGQAFPPYAQRGYMGDSVAQRPGVRLSDSRETPNAYEEPQSTQTGLGGFSPFGATMPVREAQTPPSYEESRAFLFGSTPAENYQRKLIFDPNSRVNRRMAEPIQTPQAPQTPAYTSTSAYTPSYADAYQNSLNTPIVEKPEKIVADRTQNAFTPTYETQRAEISPMQPIAPQPIEPVTPITPVAPAPQETLSYPAYEQPVAPERKESFLDEPSTGGELPAREEIPLTREEGDYRRHEYMDLFSPSNPNVFGNDEDSRGFAGETFRDRERGGVAEERGTDDVLRDTRDFTGERNDARRGIDIFDEDERDPYTLRSDFEDLRGDREAFERAPARFEEERGTGLGERFVSTKEDFPERGNADVFQSERFAQTPTSKEEPKPVPEPAKPAPKPRVIRPYVRPRLDDFDCRDVEPSQNFDEVEEAKENIIATLEDFKVTGAAIASVTFGPTVTRYNVTIPRNISPKKVVALDQSIAISLHSSGVNIYPNYEDGVVSIEVPNKERQFVQLGCMLSGDTFVNAKSSSLMFAMGKDVGNRKVYGDICKMTHLLVAGSSNSGKSVFLGALILSLIYKYSPSELRLILIDPKKTEFVLYNDLPHLMINEIITDVHKTVQSLNWAIGEMNRRYGLFEQMSRSGTYVVNLDQYNAHLDKNERLPKIVIIIDELADLMLAAKKDIEDRIQNLTQKARAAGIHLIVATQRPSTDVITGVIKSNLSTRIAFMVASDVDSRVILDQTGAQKLLGKGDFLYTMPGINTPVRVQSAFSSPEESQRVVDFIKMNNEAYYDESATAYINNTGGIGGGGDSFGGRNDEIEPVYIDALRFVILSGSASISMIQRKCSVGYNKAGKIVEWMEDMGYISSFDGAKARKVLITKEEFESKYGSL